MHAAIVIPCLDEQETLAATCTSLGFGAHPSSTPPRDTLLVLVDNGSTDQTPEVMAMIQSQAPGRVLLAHEAERGYVPPRDRGVRAARSHFASRGVAADDVLVVQADADTIYAPGYVEHLLTAASAVPHGTLLEGVAAPPPEFVRAHPGYHQLAQQADEAVEPFLVDEADEVVVDDQVAAYRLGDYFAWGGHLREYDDAGDEIHAETSRLYLRGRMLGAARCRVAAARAWPSRRKVEAAPLLYFATSGFPREDRWRGRWREPYDVRTTLDAFERPEAATVFAEAITVRQAHTVVLFGLLPAFVAWRLGRVDRRGLLRSPLRELLPELAPVTASEIASHPGGLISTALRLVDDRPALFQRLISA